MVAALLLMLGVVLGGIPAHVRAARIRWCDRPVAACRMAECGPLAGRARHRCLNACRVRSHCTAPGAGIGTIVYVVTRCRQDPDGSFSWGQKLMIRRGNRAPVTVMEVPFTSFGYDPIQTCLRFGQLRSGDNSVGVATFQRMLVLPDGSGVLFEVSNDNSYLPQYSPEPPEEGLFYVRADGTGLRRLGPATRLPLYTCIYHPHPSDPSSYPFDCFWGSKWTISSDGRTLAFVDSGPDLEGREAPQIVTLDLAGPTVGRRTQLTQLPGRLVPPTTCCPVYLDRSKISFWNDQMRLAVNVDGSGLEAIPTPMAAPNSRIIPEFAVSGGHGSVLSLYLGGEEVNQYPGISRQGIFDVFLLDGEQLLQLTNFGRSDTLAILSGKRVYVSASADPLGTNPGEHCQLFSMNRLGGDLHQLTSFRDESRPSYGCFGQLDTTTAARVGSACVVFGSGSPVSGGGVWLKSNCNPLGTNPFGMQIFSMRPDGTRLRQLTDMRGMETDPDGTVRVEVLHMEVQPSR